MYSSVLCEREEFLKVLNLDNIDALSVKLWLDKKVGANYNTYFCFFVLFCFVFVLFFHFSFIMKLCLMLFKTRNPKREK